MAITNHERVGKGLDLLRAGLQPVVERELQAKHGDQWKYQVKSALSDKRLGGKQKQNLADVAVLLVVMDKTWGQIFSPILARTDRNLVNELVDVRNRWAHQERFSSDDTDRALDSAERLLTAVSASQSDDVRNIKMELRRTTMDEQARGQRRRTAATAIESGTATALKPWREIITPHQDVASGRYQQAEFAADLWQVHIGEGTEEYRDPVEFFRRTYLTESLKRMLVQGVRRLGGNGGDPVVQLQTNFGGGKTHSMLALYHLCSGVKTTDLAGVAEVLEEAQATAAPTTNRVVLVGNKISPGNPVTKEDGTEVRTLWGELAWQLGFASGGLKEAKKAFQRIAADDERGTSPGDAIRTLMVDYGPCLILIDEWVAYARQLHDDADLPGGSFETQFTFAQALTESAKAANNCLLVISLPASDTTASPHVQADDLEVGGSRGREALVRIQNVVGRVESSWRPASAEEGFEIVRRRLFEPMTDPQKFTERDVVIRAFADYYRQQESEFPSECREASYEQRLKAAYPIHPELFDRLYTDWSTLVRFQRTRGVLRLMASVIHSLWENGDKNPLILPATIPIDDRRVQFELTRYLSDVWPPIIERDVDGPNSLPLEIDRAEGRLGQMHACRRVARTIYLGSAPTQGVANRGVEDRRIYLGTAMPGEPLGVFDDALRRLARQATYLYQDGNRYWYDTQPTVTKLAAERAGQLLREPDKVAAELDRRLRINLRHKGDFTGVHPLPQSSADVPDEPDTRLVVLDIDNPYSKEDDCPARKAAKALLETRGTSPRLFQNALVFLAPDQTRLQDLAEATRNFLAWRSILDERDQLDLSPHQVRQAESQLQTADSSVDARIPETYKWLLVPGQDTPQAVLEMQALKLSGGEPLAVRASKKLRNEELLITSFGATRLRMELDGIPLWDGDDVEIAQVMDYFARYPYLPRLQGPAVLVETIQSGVALLTWSQDAFAIAEGYDQAARRYTGLRAGEQVSLGMDRPGLLVHPRVAMAQLREETAVVDPPPDGGDEGGDGEGDTDGGTTPPPPPPQPNRYFGTVSLDSDRVGRDAAKIAEEVVAHLSGIVGSRVKVTLEIEAIVPEGFSDRVVRIVTENSRTLKFDTQGFERD